MLAAILLATAASAAHAALKDRAHPDKGSVLVDDSYYSDALVRDKRGAPVTNATRWSKTAPIGFAFNADISEATQTKVRTVLSKVAANTCLSFQENGAGNSLQFIKGDACSSGIGLYSSGKQVILLGSGCSTIGIISHEVLHALGLQHTQTRKDRDSYITINFDNVNKSLHINFEKLPEQINDNFGVPYDYGSVLHYGAGELALNKQLRVITAKEEGYDNTMGQRKYATFNDFKMINLLYKCSEKCSTQMICQNGGYPSPKDCNTCVCNDFYTGANCQTPKAVINLSTSAPGNTNYYQNLNPSLYNSGNNENWDMFGKDQVKIIKAPEGKKMKVTITKVSNPFVRIDCATSAGCPLIGLEFVDSATGDLSNMGKIFCCEEDVGRSFISKSNVIGYKAYASPGMPIDLWATFSVV